MKVKIEEIKKEAEALKLMVLVSSDVEYSPAVGRFYVNDRSVSIKTIRDYLQRIETRLGARIDEVTDSLEAKKITVEAWRREFEYIITVAHTLSAALALGSIEAAVANKDVQDRIDSELRYADKFAKEIENA